MRQTPFLLSVYVLSLLGWAMLRQFELFREGMLGNVTNAGFIVGSGVIIVLRVIEPQSTPDA